MIVADYFNVILLVQYNITICCLIYDVISVLFIFIFVLLVEVSYFLLFIHYFDNAYFIEYILCPVMNKGSDIIIKTIITYIETI